MNFPNVSYLILACKRLVPRDVFLEVRTGLVLNYLAETSLVLASLACTSLKMDDCPKPVRPSRKISRGATESLSSKYDPRRRSNEDFILYSLKFQQFLVNNGTVADVLEIRYVPLKCLALVCAVFKTEKLYNRFKYEIVEMFSIGYYTIVTSRLSSKRDSIVKNLYWKEDKGDIREKKSLMYNIKVVRAESDEFGTQSR
ncbi:hypothetical protein O3M35_009137 [Rhynocoris fuscipes]|uniref:Uncharacterized protein n=1 Tax=Rhynocoris fuscipes TaxID=488301 RepID=A0AAW1D4T4_9HEMI